MRVVSYGKDDARGRPDLGRTLVDRFFGYVTADLLQRSDHRSVQALEADIRKWVATWTRTPNHSYGPRLQNRSSASSDDLRTSNSGH